MAAKALKILGESESSLHSSFHSRPDVAKKSPNGRQSPESKISLAKSKSLADLKSHVTVPLVMKASTKHHIKQDSCRARSDAHKRRPACIRPSVPSRSDDRPRHAPKSPVRRFVDLMSRPSHFRSRSSQIHLLADDNNAPDRGQPIWSISSSPAPSAVDKAEPVEWFDRIKSARASMMTCEVGDNDHHDLEQSVGKSITDPMFDKEVEDNFSLARYHSHEEVKARSPHHRRSTLSCSIPLRDVDTTTAPNQGGSRNGVTSSEDGVTGGRSSLLPSTSVSPSISPTTASRSPKSPPCRRSSQCLGYAAGMSKLTSFFDKQPTQSPTKELRFNVRDRAWSCSAEVTTPCIESEGDLDQTHYVEDEKPYCEYEAASLVRQSNSAQRQSSLSTSSNVWIPASDPGFIRQTPYAPRKLSRKNVRRLGEQKYMAVTLEEAQLLARLRTRRAAIDEQYHDWDDVLNEVDYALADAEDLSQECLDTGRLSLDSRNTTAILEYDFPEPPTSKPSPCLSFSDCQSTLIGTPSLRGDNTLNSDTGFQDSNVKIDHRKPPEIEWPLKNDNMTTQQIDSDDVSCHLTSAVQNSVRRKSQPLTTPKLCKELILPRLVSCENSRLPSSVSCSDLSSKAHQQQSGLQARRTSRLQRANGFIVKSNSR